MIAHSLYTAALRTLLPFALARLWWRGRREPLYRRHLAERFGEYDEAPDRPVLWLHAVSVGEARASAPLARALGERHPDCRILVTCTTAAGREALKALHGESVIAAWLPYDTPRAVRRFLEHFRPRLGVLVETEVWPNLIAACRDFGVPVLLASARLSESSARGYARLAALARPAFASLAAACAQSEADAARLAALGAVRVTVTGNLKFDVAPDPDLEAAGRAWRAALGRPVLLLASTREGEEKLLLDRAPSGADALIVVVPRHPRRFDEVALLANSRRTRDPMPKAEDRVHLGDTMGEMAFYYAAADVAVIGGSFAPLGGQNLIEACAAGAPVVIGPSTYNFAEATRLAVEAGAAIQVGSAAEAMRAAAELLDDESRRRRMGAAGRRLCEAHRGATQKHLEICERLLTAAARD